MKKGKPEDFPHLNVPRPGVEPGRLAALVFETNASTNSAIWASNRVLASLFLRFAVAKVRVFSESYKLFPQKMQVLLHDMVT